MNTIKYSTNPYNVNRMTAAAGRAALKDDADYKENCRKIIKNREETASRLRDLGFTVTDSKANFLFASSPKIGGKDLYLRLKEKGILIRHFSLPEIEDYNRITVGTEEQNGALINAIEEILKGTEI